MPVKIKYNTDVQFYKNVPLKLIVYTDAHFKRLKAKRFTINGTNQNVWIPNTFLQADGTIIPGINIDFVFLKASNQLAKAGITFEP